MSYELTPTDLVWNRAAMKDGGESPRPGDIALSSLLYAHGLAMNGGVLHAVELLTPDELLAAQDGYRYFGLDDMAELLACAKTLFDADKNLEQHESQLDAEYVNLTQDESLIEARFAKLLATDPAAFAPL